MKEVYGEDDKNNFFSSNINLVNIIINGIWRSVQVTFHPLSMNLLGEILMFANYHVRQCIFITNISFYVKIL